MPRFAVRRRPSRPDGLAATGLVTVGLALGAALGFLIGELVGPRAARVTRKGATPAPSGERSVAELVHDAQSALDADVRLRDLQLEVVPVGRNALELHGWVPDRRARSAAARLVAGAVTVDRLVNCLLVRGEDDHAPYDGADQDDEAIA
jgi:hypothetical protein